MKTEIGKRLSELRKKSKITQRELANMLGIKTVTVSGYERGRVDIPISRLAAFSKIYNVSIDYLATGSNFEPTTVKTEIFKCKRCTNRAHLKDKMKRLSLKMFALSHGIN